MQKLPKPRLLCGSCCFSAIKRFISDCYAISESVQRAIQDGRPVVALESTIITHGMPYPHNHQTAQEVEEIVQECGAIPATVAALNGLIHVGVTRTQMRSLADGTHTVHKISSRDLPMAATKKLSGGTTVSATMVAAHQAGVKVFVTGGVGGVHHGVQETMDISSDLTQLSKTPVAVVCAGVKSILDIGRTLEYLETLGVCVATISDTDDFPAFFTAQSGFKSPNVLANEIEAAQLIHHNLRLGTGSGLLIAVPIPGQCTAEGERIESAIRTALAETKHKGVMGKDVTPYILGRVAELTGNASLDANIALIKNNARVGSKIAIELSKIQNSSNYQSSNIHSTNVLSHNAEIPNENSRNNHLAYHHQRNINPSNHNLPNHPPTNHQRRNINPPIRKAVSSSRIHSRPIVVGGLIVDHNVKLNDSNFQSDGATYMGQMRQIYGGVARNMADTLARLDADPLLISAVGGDVAGELVLSQSHMDTSGIIMFPDSRTATCCVLLSSDGHLRYIIADMDIFKEITPNHIAQQENAISSAPFVCVDANLSTEATTCVLEMCSHYHIPVLFEPTDKNVAGQIITNNYAPHVTMTSPNVKELCEMYGAMTDAKVPCIEDQTPDTLVDCCVSMCESLTNHIPLIITTLGHQGVIVCHRLTHPDDPLNTKDGRTDKMAAMYYPECNTEQIVSTVGAGDCMVSAFMWGLLQGRGLDLSILGGMLAARLTLQSHLTVSPDISTGALSSDNIWKSVCVKSQAVKTVY